jgi:hypothetical protein
MTSHILESRFGYLHRGHPENAHVVVEQAWPSPLHCVEHLVHCVPIRSCQMREPLHGNEGAYLSAYTPGN